jgi:hypothetical protein
MVTMETLRGWEAMEDPMEMEEWVQTDKTEGQPAGRQMQVLGPGQEFTLGWVCDDTAVPVC